MTSVCLINPPQTELRQPSAYIPLGLAYIAAVLEQSNIEVKILQLADTPMEKVNPHFFPSADWFGITCVSATYSSTVAISRMLKTHVVLGGVHPSILPYETRNDTNAHSVIMGEGEYAFRNMILEGNWKPIINAGIIKDLDSLPFPARHLFDYNDVVDTTGIHGCERGIKATTVITSRGCPFNCSFCCKGHEMFSVFRFRSAKNVRAELEMLIKKYGVEHIRFVDDAFTVNRDRVFSICDEIRDLNITWACITRADLIDEKMLRAMKESGCLECHIGVESGSARLLKLMNKQENVRTCLQAIKKIKKAGLRAKTYLMVNFPTETEEDVELTKKFMLEAKPDKWTLSSFTLIPGSDVWKHPSKYGVNTSSYSGWFYPDEHGNERYKELKAWLQDNIH
jgi:radical SAM superfamily enzyme YgiQ (UPF0313 family)